MIVVFKAHALFIHRLVVKIELQQWTIFNLSLC